jgi:hypothetical protein
MGNLTIRNKMQRVLVLDKNKDPLMPCTPARARILLSQNKAAVFKAYPFTIILKNKTQNNTQPLQIKIDQGSKTTGIALVAEFKQGKTVVFAANLQHKGSSISDKLTSRAASRRARRSRKTRYRKHKWTNSMSKKQLAHINQRPKGWFPPSVVSRIDNITNLVIKFKRFTSLNAISVENVRFDTQLMENTNIKGVEYQQGTLFEKEVKTKDGLVQGINYRYCRLLQKNDGYNYSNHTNILTEKGEGQDNSSTT